MWDRPGLINGIANVLYGAAFLGALYGAFVLIVSLPLFPLRTVALVDPPQHVREQDIAAIVKRELTGNFFTVDLRRARKAFEAVPWVRSADVRRQWPDRLIVRIEEHVPLARWGTLGLVNIQGEVFTASYEGALPVFIGPAGSSKEIAIQYAYFRKSLAPLGREPVQVSVSGRRAWTVRLDGGMTLELGRTDLEDRLARFVQNYARAHAMLNRRMEHVDLRYPNGFAVRVPELARAEAKEKRK